MISSQKRFAPRFERRPSSWALVLAFVAAAGVLTFARSAGADDGGVDDAGDVGADAAVDAAPDSAEGSADAGASDAASEASESADAGDGGGAADGGAADGGAADGGDGGEDGGAVVVGDGAVLTFPRGTGDDSYGCSCRSAGMGGDAAPLAAVAPLLALLWAGRRRRR